VNAHSSDGETRRGDLTLLGGEGRQERTRDLAAMARHIGKLFFKFFALTDELTLHTLRQSSLGNTVMNSVHTGQPAARLAQLLYTVVFSHPVFDSFGGSPQQRIIRLPEILIPFAKQLLYYMGYFPEIGVSMEPLMDICTKLKATMSVGDYSHR